MNWRVLTIILSAFCVTAFAQTTDKEWQAKAIAKYPELGVKNSELNERFLRAYADRRKTDPNFFTNPQWPLILADELASPLPPIAPATTPIPTVPPDDEQLSQKSLLPFVLITIAVVILWFIIAPATKPRKEANSMPENVRPPPASHFPSATTSNRDSQALADEAAAVAKFGCSFAVVIIALIVCVIGMLFGLFVLSLFSH